MNAAPRVRAMRVRAMRGRRIDQSFAESEIVWSEFHAKLCDYPIPDADELRALDAMFVVVDNPFCRCVDDDHPACYRGICRKCAGYVAFHCSTRDLALSMGGVVFVEAHLCPTHKSGAP